MQDKAVGCKMALLHGRSMAPVEVGSIGRAAGEPASEQRTMDELAAVDRWGEP